MITPDWVRMMARYNAWQNRWMIEAMATLPEGEAERDRGAFFGSILGTANHLLWGDEMWMSRFDDLPAPEIDGANAVRLTPDVAAWTARRKTTDGAILDWAGRLTECGGDLTWHSGITGTDISRDKATLYTHVFNHQTHHRGQVHAMLTAAGATTGTTDLAFMPDDA